MNLNKTTPQKFDFLVKFLTHLISTPQKFDFLVKFLTRLISKDSIKLKRTTKNVFKCNFYLYFPIQQKLLISGPRSWRGASNDLYNLFGSFLSKE